MEPGARRARNAFLVVAGGVALYGVVGAFVVPPIARKMIAQQAGERLGRIVEIDEVSVNPYTLRAVVKGLRILEPDRKSTFASFDTLDLDGSIASVYRRAPVVDALTLAGLRVHLVRGADSRYNLDDILKRLAAAAPTKGPGERGEEPARFSVGNIRIVDGAVDFDDRPVGRKHVVDAIQVAIPFISNLPVHLKDQVQPAFSARVNGAPLKLTGEALPFENTVRTHFNLELRALDLPRYMAYLPSGLPVQVRAGKLDAALSLRFTQAPGKDPVVDVAGTLSLGDVALEGAEGPLGRLARADADIASLDPLGGRVQLRSVKLAGASAMQDQWRVATAEASDIAVDLKAHAIRVASIATRGGQFAVKRDRDGAIEAPRLPASDDPVKWNVSIAKAAVAGYGITLQDAAVRPAVTHRFVLASLDASDLSTTEGLKGNALARVDFEHGGSLDVSSTFALEPLRVEAKLDARALDLVPLRAYVTQFPGVAVKSGSASAKGTVTLARQGGAIRVAYAGGAAVDRLATVDALDQEDLLNWKAVRASGVRFAYSADAPLELEVGEIVVDKAYSRIVVTPEGKLNMQQLRTATPGEPEPSPTSAPPRPRNVRIDRITFRDSRLDFTDHYIKPNYSADVGELQGAVTQLSSDPASRATVDLRGRWDSSSPVTIAGTVNPLAGDLFLDIAAKGQDVELPKLTAYAIRYAGYPITGGRLTLDVKYHVEHGKMEGRNRILVDQLTFGEKVEGPDATTLPVLFAVNLLKDAQGRIDLQLPISGSLDDPKFDLGALVSQVVGDLLKKAVTSPFSLIAAALGAGAGAGDGGTGQDYAFVQFEPGRADIPEAGRRKLEALVKALRDRPGLKLEVTSRPDEASDRKALQELALQQKAASLPKDMSKEAREKALQEPIVIAPEVLAGLAARRGEAVVAQLVGEGRLAAERVALAAAASAPTMGTQPGASRVELSLR